MRPDPEADTLDTVREALRRVGLSFPYLVGLIQKIDVQLDRRVETMGVFASGRLLVNPDFARALTPREMNFLLTHQLYHLVLRTHERGEGSDALDFNIAHDYVINDMLREELHTDRIPAGGVDWRGARLLSAEKILREMERDSSRRPSQLWDSRPGRGGGSGDGEADEGQGEPAEGDVLSSAREREMFPETQPLEQQARVREVQERAAQAQGLRSLMQQMSEGKGDEAGGQENEVAALRGLYRPPWELALQRWLEAVAPADRSYARPSRRGADRTDVVLPGRKREGWTLHVVLDTSGSMIEEIPVALGAIADFCEAVGVDRVHLLQCDTAVGSDEVLTPAEVSRWRVTGYGGSDLGPAMVRLADDPEVAAALVLTDGEIDYPEEPVPYQVLWVLPPWKEQQEFSPRYGKVIAMAHA
jgi:predicted metal-dependent peptidase